MGRKASYGRGHPRFLEYVKFIVEHPVYKGMPDAILDDGGVQWEAPSNRQGGKFKDTHHKRREWWRRKAIEIGVDPSAGAGWISQTAKRIHPTKEKPCKICGRILDIRYVYPSALLLGRLRDLPYIDGSFALDPLEHVRDLVSRMVEQFGDQVFSNLPNLLKANGVRIPALGSDLDPWLQWIEREYVPLEPKTLSPGAMSNAPDRFDGFHSFNRCCRATADRGRSKQNLQSYTTDRRVFEYWVDGDWIAADELMGVIRSNTDLQRERCLNDHPGPCSADHIGPVSLGFAHRPEFALLCRACNSTKNNRMSHDDVRALIAAEARGEVIASWYAEELWNSRKSDVDGDEKALRLSKMLRDNRHSAMHMLNVVAARGHLAFLTTLLGLPYAERNPEFEGIHVDDGLVKYEQLVVRERATVYAVEQKARRLRVAVEVLRAYVTKDGRNALLVKTPEIMGKIEEVLASLAGCPKSVGMLDEELRAIFAEDPPSEEKLRSVVSRLPSPEREPTCFTRAKTLLKEAMQLVGQDISVRWTDERYVRAQEEP